MEELLAMDDATLLNMKKMPLQLLAISHGIRGGARKNIAIARELIKLRNEYRNDPTRTTSTFLRRPQSLQANDKTIIKVDKKPEETEEPPMASSAPTIAKKPSGTHVDPPLVPSEASPIDKPADVAAAEPLKDDGTTDPIAGPSKKPNRRPSRPKKRKTINKDPAKTTGRKPRPRVPPPVSSPSIVGSSPTATPRSNVSNIPVGQAMETASTAPHAQHPRSSAPTPSTQPSSHNLPVPYPYGGFGAGYPASFVMKMREQASHSVAADSSFASSRNPSALSPVSQGPSTAPPPASVGLPPPWQGQVESPAPASIESASVSHVHTSTSRTRLAPTAQAAASTSMPPPPPPPPPVPHKSSSRPNPASIPVAPGLFIRNGPRTPEEDDDAGPHTTIPADISREAKETGRMVVLIPHDMTAKDIKTELPSLERQAGPNPIFLRMGLRPGHPSLRGPDDPRGRPTRVPVEAYQHAPALAHDPPASHNAPSAPASQQPSAQPPPPVPERIRAMATAAATDPGLARALFTAAGQYYQSASRTPEPSPAAGDPEKKKKKRRGREADDADVRALVQDMADMAAIQEARRRRLEGFDTDLSRFEGGFRTLGALVRQERAAFNRMQPYLDFANVEMPDAWDEEAVWDRAGKLLHEEETDRYVEMESDDEDGHMYAGAVQVRWVADPNASKEQWLEIAHAETATEKKMMAREMAEAEACEAEAAAKEESRKRKRERAAVRGASKKMRQEHTDTPAKPQAGHPRG
ncbi:uncharacterized protein BXZ73DRAFT_74509 [Epithele typhae]|uniref:uncharacterized protein n=1 Tax=Epithele typhae TaxID=378194 RepID=UPI0020075BC5|nr:uncharacterized protein BXZ73DRAFT_74509 [Epithele typhae]KAH9942212.1 hypothetical protein BXZ73DRAFT_74509 [Epithele typhae]